ncbi:CBN-PCAF-1 protein [Aphelenchoides avenae]|nr:CBN-PCAF-1 protein [Aphelenchus avenae]
MFLNPVPNEVDLQIYLADVNLKVEENQYHHERYFITGIRRMFSNCYLFNGYESPYYEMGYNLNKTFLELCKQHFPGSTLMPQLPERKPNVKKH